MGHELVWDGENWVMPELSVGDTITVTREPLGTVKYVVTKVLGPRSYQIIQKSVDNPVEIAKCADLDNYG